MTHPDDRASCGKLLARLDKEEASVVKMEKRYVKKNGELMWASLTASVIVTERQASPLPGPGARHHRGPASRPEMAEQAALLN